MEIFILHNSLSYLSDERYEEFIEMGWLRKVAFLIQCLLLEFLTGLFLRLLMMVLYGMILTPIRMFTVPFYCKSLGRLERYEACNRIYQTYTMSFRGY